MQSWIHLHMSLLHASKATMNPLITRKLLTDLPDKIHKMKPFDCTCYICQLNKTNKIPRGRLVDKSTLSPFQRIHADFVFYTVPSIRGFTSAFDITCSSTSYPFGFPGKTKSPPLDVFKWFINTIRSMGYIINFLRVDEDGALARSAAFCSLVMDLNLILETTGGGNSENNGMVERSNRTKGDMVRSQLSTLKLLLGKDQHPEYPVEKFWCYAHTHACFTMRRSYNRMRQSTPYFLVHGSRPSYKDLTPFGSIMTIVAPNKAQKSKLAHDRCTRGYFVGFSNNCRICLYWDPLHPSTIKRSRHNVIEDIATLTILQKSILSPSTIDEEEPCPDLYKRSILTTDNIDISDEPFPTSDIISVSMTLPALPTTIGLVLHDDTLLNLPYIKRTIAGSVAHATLSTLPAKEYYIISINSEGPITANIAANILSYHQSLPNKDIIFDLVPKLHDDTTTSLSSTRVLFDQLPSILHNRPIISSSIADETNSYDHFCYGSDQTSGSKVVL